jgi:BMFP domain-containing protein YqiC
MSEMDDSQEVVTKGFFRQEMRKEFAAFRDSFRMELRAELREDIREMLRPMVANIANLQADVTDIRGYMKTQLVTREEFHARMDAFAGRVDTHDYSAAKNRDRLDDHERRISALEKKPS